MSDVCGRITFYPLGKSEFSRMIFYSDTMAEIADQISGEKSFVGPLKLVSHGSEIFVSLDISGGGKRGRGLKTDENEDTTNLTI